MSLSGTLEPLLRYPSRRYRWWRLLRSCSLDPDRLDRPVEEPGPRDFIICGIPRSGTSLIAALLHQPPDVVVAMEPWDGLRMPPATLFRSLRDEISQTGGLARTRLDDQALVSDGTVRWMPHGTSTQTLSLKMDYQLGVKWPTYWRYLDMLEETRFLVCIRHPADVVDSFVRAGGQLSRGLDYRVAYNRRMNRHLRRTSPEPAVRRALLWEYIASRVVPHLGRDNVLVLRYEQWLNDPAALLGEIRAFLGLPYLELNLSLTPPAARRSARNEELVRELCPSAAAFGYTT